MPDLSGITAGLSVTTVIAAIVVVIGLMAIVNFSSWGGKKAAKTAQ